MNLIQQIVKDGKYGTQTIKMIVKSNERGAQGEQGEKGEAATIAAGQAYSVPANVGPAVMNVGTSSNAVFDFYIPRGETEWGDIVGNINNQADLRTYLQEADSAVQPDDINYTVMQDLAVSSNGSTSVLQLDADKVNLKTGATSTKNIPLTVASHDKAGVVNSATFDAIVNNSTAVETILSGMVAIPGLPASPTQAELTTAWETATERTELINRAQILDVDNSKYWTYYTNTQTWYGATADIEGSVTTFTNSTEGVIKGSTTVGQVYAESNGTGSVNGWDALSAAVADNTANKLASANLTSSNGVTATTTGSGANTKINLSLTDAGVTTAKIADTAVTTDKIENSAVTTAKIASQSITTAKFYPRAVNRAVETDINLTPTEDTPAAWRTLMGTVNGYYMTYYNATGKFTNQPAQWGFLETFITTGNVYQRWLTHSTGPIMFRAGNTNGWNGTGAFTELISTKTTDYVKTDSIQDSAVATAKIANSAVTTAKIADANVTSGKLASSSVTTAKIVDTAVTTAKIKDANVTADKLASSAVTTAKIASGAVTAGKLDWTAFNFAYKATAAKSWTPTSTAKTYPSGWDFSFTAVSGGTYEIECCSSLLGVLTNTTPTTETGIGIEMVSGGTILAHCAGDVMAYAAGQIAKAVVTATSTTVKVKAYVLSTANKTVSLGGGMFTVKRIG